MGFLGLRYCLIMDPFVHPQRAVWPAILVGRSTWICTQCGRTWICTHLIANVHIAHIRYQMGTNPGIGSTPDLPPIREGRATPNYGYTSSFTYVYHVM